MALPLGSGPALSCGGASPSPARLAGSGGRNHAVNPLRRAGPGCAGLAARSGASPGHPREPPFMASATLPPRTHATIRAGSSLPRFEQSLCSSPARHHVAPDSDVDVLQPRSGERPGSAGTSSAAPAPSAAAVTAGRPPRTPLRRDLVPTRGTGDASKDAPASASVPVRGTDDGTPPSAGQPSNEAPTTRSHGPLRTVSPVGPAGHPRPLTTFPPSPDRTIPILTHTSDSLGKRALDSPNQSSPVWFPVEHRRSGVGKAASPGRARERLTRGLHDVGGIPLQAAARTGRAGRSFHVERGNANPDHRGFTGNARRRTVDTSHPRGIDTIHQGGQQNAQPMGREHRSAAYRHPSWPRPDDVPGHGTPAAPVTDAGRADPRASPGRYQPPERPVPGARPRSPRLGGADDPRPGLDSALGPPSLRCPSGPHPTSPPVRVPQPLGDGHSGVGPRQTPTPGRWAPSLRSPRPPSSVPPGSPHPPCEPPIAGRRARATRHRRQPARPRRCAP
jgi:hypothetical protein